MVIGDLARAFEALNSGAPAQLLQGMQTMAQDVSDLKERIRILAERLEALNQTLKATGKGAIVYLPRITPSTSAPLMLDIPPYPYVHFLDIAGGLAVAWGRTASIGAGGGYDVSVPSGKYARITNPGYQAITLFALSAFGWPMTIAVSDRPDAVFGS